MTDLRLFSCLAASALMLTACTDDPSTSTTAGVSESAGSTGDDPTTGTPPGPTSNSNSDSNSGDSSDTSDTTPLTTGDTDGSTTDDTITDDGTTGGTTDEPTGSDSGGTTDDGTTSGSSSTGDESSSSTGTTEPDTHQLYQGVFNGAQYEYAALGAIPILDITGGPEDTDWTRWAMLHAEDGFRLYFMQEGADDTIYQFVFNPATQDYEFGLGAAIDELGITNIPIDADMSSFAMLYGQENYRLYAKSLSDPLSIHQFAYNAATQSYEYGFDGSIPQIDVTGFPAAADDSGWGMLFESDNGEENFRFYSFASAAHTSIAQGSYNFDTQDYEYGHNSIPQINIISFPDDTNTDDFAMLHDGDEFRLYMLRD